MRSRFSSAAGPTPLLQLLLLLFVLLVLLLVLVLALLQPAPLPYVFEQSSASKSCVGGVGGGDVFDLVAVSGLLLPNPRKV
jgi:hypothetical protein